MIWQNHCQVRLSANQATSGHVDFLE